MRIKIRPVVGGDFEVEVDENETVETLKAIIISTRSDCGDDTDNVKLVWKGQVLDSSLVIKERGIKDNDFMAMMVKNAAAAASSGATTGAPAPQPSAPQQHLPGTPLGPPSEEQVTTLCGMGFGRDEVIKALKVAFNNPDRAMQYLLDGNVPVSAAPMEVDNLGGGVASAGAWPENMLGAQLMSRDTSGQAQLIPTSQALKGAPVVLLYFSAHWCPPCRQFTPQLINAYNSLGGAGQTQLQVVFCSSDRDASSFGTYFSSMPWTAVPFGTPQAQSLGMTFQVRGIPAVVALDGRTGVLLDGNARDAISSNRFDLIACCRQWGRPVVAGPPQVVPPVASAAPVDVPKKSGPPPLPIDKEAAKAALDHIAESTWEVQEAFYSTLLKVLNNILQNPTEEKFRTLKKGNSALQTKLFSVADGLVVTLLGLAGFQESDEVVALVDVPDGRCTALRDFVQEHAEAAQINQLRKERDARIAMEIEKDKSKVPPRGGGGGSGGPERNTYGGGRRRGGGG